MLGPAIANPTEEVAYERTNRIAFNVKLIDCGDRNASQGADLDSKRKGLSRTALVVDEGNVNREDTDDEDS